MICGTVGPNPRTILIHGSPLGASQIDNFLNTMGGANILLWKRKAEHYLMASGLEYTIIHPGRILLPEDSNRTSIQ